MRLSGWSRVGVVLSAIWALGVIGAAISKYNSAPDVHSVLVSWADSKPKPWQVDWANNPPKKGDTFDPDAYLRSKGMTQQEIDALSHEPHFRWGSIFLVIFVPILACWLLAIVGRLTVLWVAAGFKQRGG